MLELVIKHTFENKDRMPRSILYLCYINETKSQGIRNSVKITCIV